MAKHHGFKHGKEGKGGKGFVVSPAKEGKEMKSEHHKMHGKKK